MFALLKYHLVIASRRCRASCGRTTSVKNCMSKTNSNYNRDNLTTLHILSRFVLEDVAFTFLPLAVIALLQVCLGTFDSSFFNDTEWSFASIILYGLVMTRVLELKLRYQKDSSERVFALMRMCILGLIASVLTLALSQMDIAGLKVHREGVLLFQFCVLGFGLLLLLQCHLARERFVRQREELPPNMNMDRYLHFILSDLKDARNQVDELSLRMAKRNSLVISDVQKIQDLQHLINRQTRDVDHLIADLGSCLDRLRAARNGWNLVVPSAPNHEAQSRRAEAA
jgi:hypothetical protein